MPSRMEAVRWELAASAAAEGSRLEASAMRPSCIVGLGFFVEAVSRRKILLFENFLDSPL